MTEHRAGPWRVTDRGVRDDGGYIALAPAVTHFTGQDERYQQEIEERAANALLIAASPELLNLAKCNLATMEEVRRSCIRWDKPHNELNAAIAETICLIARITQ